MAVARSTRLNALLQRELGAQIESLVAPGLSALITVTDVRIADNLRDATVYVSIYGAPADKNRALEQLERKRVILQNALASKVIMKYTPVLHFRVDETAEHAERVMQILKELDLPEDDPAAKDRLETDKQKENEQ